MFAERHVVNIDDVDELRKLRVQLGNSRIGAGHHERHAGYGGIVGWRNVEGLDVVAPAREHPGYSRQGADLVL